MGGCIGETASNATDNTCGFDWHVTQVQGDRDQYVFLGAEQNASLLVGRFVARVESEAWQQSFLEE